MWGGKNNLEHWRIPDGLLIKKDDFQVLWSSRWKHCAIRLQRNPFSFQRWACPFLCEKLLHFSKMAFLLLPPIYPFVPLRGTSCKWHSFHLNFYRFIWLLFPAAEPACEGSISLPHNRHHNYYFFVSYLFLKAFCFFWSSLLCFHYYLCLPPVYSYVLYMCTWVYVKIY